MSGSLSTAVDASIPLQAGKGVQAPNPLQQVGDFARTMGAINQLKLFPGQQTLQQQAIQGGAAGLAQKLNQVGATMLLPSLSNPDFTLNDLTNAAAAVENHGGGSTQATLGLIGALPYAPNTPEWRQAVKQSLASLAQTNSAEAVAQIAGTPGSIQTANGTVSGVVSPATTGAAFTPATTTPMGVAPTRATGYATPADVAAGRASAVGQPMHIVLPGETGGTTTPAGAPAGNLGPGTYRPPQRPLTQLGPAYAPPGGAPAAPATAPPRLMTAPDGSKGWVPASEVPAAMQRGYR